MLQRGPRAAATRGAGWPRGHGQQEAEMKQLRKVVSAAWHKNNYNSVNKA
jgi:hypothetical protein